MSNASGIQVSPALKSAFDSARRNNDVSFLKVQIVSDRLECAHTERRSSLAGSGWARDFDRLAHYADDDTPAFFVFWKGKDEFLLVLYVPDSSKVKDKMSYSSSKSALTSLLSAATPRRVEHVYATSRSELSHASYARHAAVAGPRSEVEEALHNLPRALERKEFAKSQGYSLLAAVSGKALPPQLQGYANGGGGGGGNASHGVQGGSSLYRGAQVTIQGGAYARPSDIRASGGAAVGTGSAARSTSGGSGGSVNRPPAGVQILPGFGSAASKNAATPASSVSSPTHSSPSPSSSPSSSSSAASASPSSSPSAAASASASSFASSRPAAAAAVPTSSKCVVESCGQKRVKGGYCFMCLHANEARRKEVEQAQE